MPSILSRELRAHRKIERRDLTQAEKDAGYIGAVRSVIPYNSDSGDLRDRSLNNGKAFREQIAPGAFKRSLASDKGLGNVVAFVGHTDDPLAAFARSGANLTFTDTDAGLEWEALAPDTAACRDLMKLVDGAVIRGASFEFSVPEGGDRWETRDGKDIRIVTEANLYAVNPVAWPAYDDGALTVALRSRARRDLYAYSYDGTYSEPMDDIDFAEAALAQELNEFTAAQDYLRDNPQGAHVAYAQRVVEECPVEIKAMLDWLVANGGKPEADTMDRARRVAGEKRSAPSAAATAKQFPITGAQAARLGITVK